MSSCLINGGGRTYRLDLEIVAKSSSPSSRSSHSSPVSTLSESSTSAPFSISTKRARAPRKRPNQSSDEAAALLSTISPKLFSPANHRRTNYFHNLLPSFPIPDDAVLLLRDPPSPENKNPIRFCKKMPGTAICSPGDFEFQDTGSPEFVAESILDEEVDENIESIMGVGNLSMSSGYRKDGDEDGLMGFGDIQFGFGISSNMRRALKRSDDGEWWRSPVVVVKDIVQNLKEPPPVKTQAKKKKNKKKEMVVKKWGVEGKDIAAYSSPEDEILTPELGLKLNYDNVMKEWSGKSPYSGEAGSVKSAAHVIARLTDAELFSDAGGGVMRETSIQRYKEKRVNRLFSKNIRYHVRKVNADQRPRMKASILGRFSSIASLLEKAVAEESQ
ncbi:Protein CHLOROPLAST IMPORT APPARATUS 2 [Platanthera guangdongensis]|uniref:Protein CHLOROPLAST IMPORT APPARATUS 2 n=1 Tax=Platanthera guangdongensis TaxID=2320717 RepID=A0ABR2MU80_9ASPA